MSEPTVVVTGASGFIGSRVVCELLRRDAGKVVACDISADAANLRDVLEGIEFVRADVASFESVLRVFDKYRPRAIYHLGAMLGPACDASPEAGIRTNAVGTYHVLEAARLVGTAQVIFASSISVFAGNGAGQSVVDDYSATRPDTIYAAAKAFSENLGLSYRRLHGLDFRSLRIPGVVGPGLHGHGFFEYVSKSISSAIAGEPYSVYVAPETRVPLIYVDDIARAFADLAAAPREGILTANYLVLGPNPVPSAQQVVERVRARVPGAQLDFHVNPEIQKVFDTLPRAYDDRHARQEWGWRAQYDLDAIIEAFVARARQG